MNFSNAHDFRREVLEIAQTCLNLRAIVLLSGQKIADLSSRQQEGFVEQLQQFANGKLGNNQVSISVDGRNIRYDFTNFSLQGVRHLSREISGNTDFQLHNETFTFDTGHSVRRDSAIPVGEETPVLSLVQFRA